MNYLITEYIRLRELEEEVKNHESLATENKKLRKLLRVHQQVFSYNGLGTTEGSYQCPHCPKSFYDINFLKGHLTRRHPKSGLEIDDPLSLSKRIATYHSVCSNESNKCDKITQELAEVREKLDKTEQDLYKEREARLNLEEKVELDIEEKVKEAEVSLRSQLNLAQFERKMESSGFKDGDETDHSSNEQDQQLSFAKLMLHHTQEVQKLGTNIQMLANSISKNYSPPTAHRFQGSVKQLSPEVPKVIPKVIVESPQKEMLMNDESHPISDSSEDEEELVLEEDQVLEYLGSKLESLGIQQNSTGVSNDVYKASIKALKAEQSSNISSSRKWIDQIVEDNINQRSKTQVKLSRSPYKKILRSSNFEKNKSESDEATKAIKGINEAAKKTEFTVRADVEPLRTTTSKTIGFGKKPIASSRSLEAERYSAQQASGALRLKSALSKKYADEEDTAENGKVSQKRRISFCDTRTEISPEQSDSDLDEIPLFDVQKMMAQPSPAPQPRPRTATLAPTRPQDRDESSHDESAHSGPAVDADKQHKDVQYLTKLIERKLTTTASNKDKPVSTLVPLPTHSLTSQTGSVQRLDDDTDSE